MHNLQTNPPKSSFNPPEHYFDKSKLGELYTGAVLGVPNGHGYKFKLNKSRFFDESIIAIFRFRN